MLINVANSHRRKFPKKEGCQEAERKKLTGLVYYSADAPLQFLITVFKFIYFQRERVCEHKRGRERG